MFETISPGEYQRAAYILRSKENNQKVSSKLGIFLSVYALYLAGEKIKDQIDSETCGESAANSVKNPFLNEIYKELTPLYSDGGMDGHLLYIYGVVVRDLQKTGANTELIRVSAGELFLKSVALFPWNW